MMMSNFTMHTKDIKVYYAELQTNCFGGVSLSNRQRVDLPECLIDEVQVVPVQLN